MKQKIIIFLVIIILILSVAIGIYQGFFKKEKPIFTLAEVIRGNISQEVSETGQVRKSEEINLSFKNAGRIEKIYVGVGEKVKRGDILAKQDTTQFEIQLEDAKADLSLALAQLNKLLAGASPEEIQIAKTAVENAKISLEQAEQNLKDTERLAVENLKAAYEDALNILDDAYPKADNAFMIADSIQKSYFTKDDQEGIRVRENRDAIEKAVSQIKTSLETAKANSSQKNIDPALSEIKNALDKILSSLRFIREVSESSAYRNIVSSTDKTSLDNQKNYISTALTNVTNSAKNISQTKLTNESNINTAKAQISAAESSLKAAQDELSRLLSPPPKEDVQLHRNKVAKAKNQVELLENQIKEATLYSPVEGQIAKIKKREGEMAQPMLKEAAMILLPAAPFEIEADIYEEDAVKINIDNPVDISLADFPEKIFKGKVISIDPAQKLIEGVVYYTAAINFDEIPEGIKPGMTADLVIKTASKENVLIVPERAIQKKDDKSIVQVSKNGVIEEREIEIGLRGSNSMVEVLSGLEEGEKVIIKYE
jgi:HlyD family secretion protein